MEANELPDGWIEAPLGDILPIQYGKGLVSAGRNFNGQVPVYGSSGIIGYHDQALTTKATLIVGRKGSVGSVHYSPLPCWPIDTTYFTEENTNTNLKFFLYLLSYLKLNQFDKSTAIPGLSRDDYNVVAIKIAPLPEQPRIVAAIEQQFTRLDAGVAALKSAQTRLKRYRAAVLKSAVEGKLTEAWRAEHPTSEPASVLLERILVERRAKWEADLRAKGKNPAKVKYVEPAAPDVTGLPKLPEGWCWSRAEQLCDFITKGTTPSAEKLQSGTGDIPFIKVYNLTTYGTLDFTVNPTFVSKETHSHELARSRVFPGDVLMNIVGPPLGKVSVVPNIYAEWNINQAVVIFRPMSSYNRNFLCVTLLTESVLSWAIIRAKATAGQFNLTLEICRDLPLPLPPLEEQQQIVAEVERRLSVVSQLEATVEANLKRAERMRQSILKEAFAGRLVPQDPNDEPASILLGRIRQEREAYSEHKQGKQQSKQGKGKKAKEKANPQRQYVANITEQEPEHIDISDIKQVALWNGVAD